jgi:hypothetical protein
MIESFATTPPCASAEADGVAVATQVWSRLSDRAAHRANSSSTSAPFRDRLHKFRDQAKDPVRREESRWRALKHENHIRS